MVSEILIGTSAAMLETVEIVERAASRRATVLITGETDRAKRWSRAQLAIRN